MRLISILAVLGLAALVPSSALGQGAVSLSASSLPAPTPGLSAALVEIERLHAEAVVDKQRLMHAVLGAGGVSIVSGGLMMITDANDQAYRVAGGCALVFGVIDAAIALTSLRGIGRDARVWESDRAGRVTGADLQRARARWLAAERGEGVAYAVNLGLDIAYLSSGLTAVLASQLGAEHPERWLAGGLSVSVQALLLVGIDLAGLGQAGRLQKRLLHDLVPGVSLIGAYAEPAVRLTVAGRL